MSAKPEMIQIGKIARPAEKINGNNNKQFIRV